MIHGAGPRPRSVRVALAVLAACLTLLGGATSCASEPSAKHHEFVIPQGSMRLASVGRAPVVFPARLVVHVGDTITIVNDDDFDTVAGPYLVKAKSSVTQQFASPGELKGSCVLGAGDYFTLTVLARET